MYFRQWQLPIQQNHDDIEQLPQSHHSQFLLCHRSNYLRVSYRTKRTKRVGQKRKKSYWTICRDHTLEKRKSCTVFSSNRELLIEMLSGGTCTTFCCRRRKLSTKCEKLSFVPLTENDLPTQRQMLNSSKADFFVEIVLPGVFKNES